MKDENDRINRFLKHHRTNEYMAVQSVVSVLQSQTGVLILLTAAAAEATATITTTKVYSGGGLAYWLAWF